MAEKAAPEKDALKARKDAEKAAKKAKEERIKQSKPKKDGNVFERIKKAVVKFFKDFIGTCKKIVWPNRKTVFKNTGIVLVSIILVGLVVFLIDLGLSKGFEAAEEGLIDLGKKSAATTEADLIVTDEATEVPTEVSTEETSGEEESGEAVSGEEESGEAVSGEDVSADENAEASEVTPSEDEATEATEENN